MGGLGASRRSHASSSFEIDCALGGEQGLEKVRAASLERRPYVVAYVDERMQAGWSGIQTINNIWREFEMLHVVFCTAVSDHSWTELQEQLGESDRLFILKKPFDPLEVRQLTFAIAERARMESEIRAAWREADRANQAKSEFLSRVSHELRTPLNAVLGYAQILSMEESLGEEQREYVGEILHGGRYLLTLVNEVLDVARIEAGEMLFSICPVDVCSLVDETVALLSPLARTRSIQLTAPSVAAGETTAVLADAGRLKQVLLNLVSNAIKYNREGGSVELRLVSLPAEKQPRVRIEVEDTGEGIDPDKIGRLFTCFDRLGAESTHVEVEGAGLGLALAKRMTELMGGVLGVESVVGKGTIFWVELPAGGCL